jgi:mercuric ion binding protein
MLRFFAVDIKYIYLSKKEDMKSLPALMAFIVLALSLYSCGKGSFKEESFYVRGNCEMCKERLESGVKTLSGVTQAKYSVKDEMLKVTYDTTITNRVAIEKQCSELGHGTHDYPMNEKKHEALPECCKVSHNEGKH